jgi:hypothetical protein
MNHEIQQANTARRSSQPLERIGELIRKNMEIEIIRFVQKQSL